VVSSETKINPGPRFFKPASSHQVTTVNLIVTVDLQKKVTRPVEKEEKGLLAIFNNSRFHTYNEIITVLENARQPQTFINRRKSEHDDNLGPVIDGRRRFELAANATGESSASIPSLLRS
jgi:hypothetical protein